MDKAFTLRLVRCLLIGLGAFVFLLALDIKIRSPLDVAGYVLGIGALWYVFEIIVMKPAKKPTQPPPPPPQNQAQKQAPPPRKTTSDQNSLGEDHFD